MHNVDAFSRNSKSLWSYYNLHKVADCEHNLVYISSMADLHGRQFVRKCSHRKWLRLFLHIYQKSVSKESWNGSWPPRFVRVNNEGGNLLVKTHGMMVWIYIGNFAQIIVDTSSSRNILGGEGSVDNKYRQYLIGYAHDKIHDARPIVNDVLPKCAEERTCLAPPLLPTYLPSSSYPEIPACAMTCTRQVYKVSVLKWGQGSKGPLS